MAKPTTSILADHYKALGREEKAAAIRTWLNAVRDQLRSDLETAVKKAGHDGTRNDPGTLHEHGELRGGIAIIGVLLERMDEASDAAPADSFAQPALRSPWPPSDVCMIPACGCDGTAHP